MTRIADIQRKNQKLRLKIVNKNNEIKKMNETKEKTFEEFTAYIQELHHSYDVMLSLERDHVFDRYESHATAMKYREEQKKKEIDFEVIKDKA